MRAITMRKLARMDVLAKTVLLCMAVHFVDAPAFAGNPLGAPDWSAFIPFRQVEAKPETGYELTDERGPWLILAASFAGDGAEHQARALVYELRRNHQLPAYLTRQHFDFSERVIGRGRTEKGLPLVMKHRHDAKYDEIAVLVGDFPDIHDARAQKTLEKIKYLNPKALEINSRAMEQGRLPTYQRFGVWREMQREITPDDGKKRMGPMRAAFLTPNPKLPKEFFASKGLDPFVESMNSGVEFSLLKCPGNYTVKVATFRGNVTMEVGNSKDLDRPAYYNGGAESRLAVAADKARRLANALRKRGVEAYEFHDRQESIVTVGSFTEVGRPRADGKMEINPAIHRLMTSYGAEQKNIAGHGAAMIPKTFAGITMDVQPVPVAVPRPSFANRNASRSIFGG